jgi:hypothetical protein
MENKPMPKIISRDELIGGYKHHLTVGDLKEFLEKNNLPDDAKVMIQRVEDVYFEKNNWGVYLKEGYWYHSIKEMNENMLAEAKRIEEGLEPEYDMEDPLSKVIDLDDELKDQYHPAWSCVRYNDDQDLLFIDLHY